ncbi:hypothetical protein KCV06_g644, partial [Aureobasidium melanogenum]
MENEGWSRTLRPSRGGWEGKLGFGSSGGRRFVGLVWEEKRRGSVGGRLVSEVRFLLPVTKMRVMMALISRRLWLVETWSRGGCVELAAALWLSQCWYGVDPVYDCARYAQGTFAVQLSPYWSIQCQRKHSLVAGPSFRFGQNISP